MDELAITALVDHIQHRIP